MQNSSIAEVFTTEQVFYRTSRVGNEPARLNARHDHFLLPVREKFAGARVLDLACHNGRWTYAALQAGAASVTGVDFDQELIEVAKGAFSAEIAAGQVRVECGDLVEFLRNSRAGEYDIVLCLGMLYHTLRQSEILHLCRRLQPKLLVIDSSVIRGSSRDRVRDSIQISPVLARHAEIAADQEAIAIAGVAQDGRWEILPSARMLEVWIEDAGFKPWRVPLAQSRYNRGMTDYLNGLRVSYHCYPK